MAEADVPDQSRKTGAIGTAQVPYPVDRPVEDRPLWTTADPGAPDDGWLLTRPAPIEPSPHRPRDPRRPALALPALVVLALLAAFFAWVTAEPLWLALGHAQHGTATVTRCTGSGITERCIGTFTAPGIAADDVALLNLTHAQRTPDTTVPAMLVSPTSSRAYSATHVTADLHLRWAIGLLLTLLSGLAIAWTTGARRLPTRRGRRVAFALSLAAPFALTAAFLALSA